MVFIFIKMLEIKCSYYLIVINSPDEYANKELNNQVLYVKLDKKYDEINSPKTLLSKKVIAS